MLASESHLRPNNTRYAYQRPGVNNKCNNFEPDAIREGDNIVQAGDLGTVHLLCYMHVFDTEVIPGKSIVDKLCGCLPTSPSASNSLRIPRNHKRRRSPEGQLPPRAPRPLVGRGRVRGGTLGQWDWGSENAGVKAICLLYFYSTSCRYVAARETYLCHCHLFYTRVYLNIPVSVARTPARAMSSKMFVPAKVIVPFLPSFLLS